MEDFKFKIGSIVRVTNGGRTYPLMAEIFEKLNFKNKQINKWKYSSYEGCPDLFIIANHIILEFGTETYKIISIKDPDIEYLIDNSGIEFVRHNNFNKLKIV